MRTFLTLAGILALAASAGCSRNKDRDVTREEQQPRTETRQPQRAPETTDKTQREAEKTVPAAEQKEDTADSKITRQIHVAIVKDDKLSTDAENVEVMTADGVVTLRGTVDSKADKKAIERMARTTTGVKKVDNQLEVAAAAGKQKSDKAGEKEPKPDETKSDKY